MYVPLTILQQQYSTVKTSLPTQQNINLLQKKNTFTITTGHQLNLFTGPLYFLYKIISTINLCKELSVKFPAQNFVPIYWMATEDHDFEEINYFNFEGVKIKWNTHQKGAVGRFSTKGLAAVFEKFASLLGNSKNANKLKKLFRDGYLKHNNLSDATKYIVNELFADDGLVIIDADNKNLKKNFIPYMKEDLLNHISYKSISKTIKKLKKKYKIQVNPRKINLFYLADKLRERLLFENGVYKVNNTNIKWSESEILSKLNNFPEQFSPNVILRPLYQEVILPNLCYIGGGGELAYWLELKDYFNAANIPFPILLLRNSLQIISEKQEKTRKKLTISIEELFLKKNDLIAKKVSEKSKIKVNFSEQKKELQAQFNQLKEIAKKTDKSFIGAVNAQEKKQLKGLEKLENRLLRAEKRKYKELVDRITILQNQLFPNQNLEERQRNFSEYFLKYGDFFITTLKKQIKPLQLEFLIIEMQ